MRAKQHIGRQCLEQFTLKCFLCFANNFLGKVFQKENHKNLIHTQNLGLSEIFFLNLTPSIHTHTDATLEDLFLRV
jgi:hypothetical protein